MHDDTDDPVLDRPRSALLERLDRQKATEAEPAAHDGRAPGPWAAADDPGLLPRPGDPYKAYARIDNKPVAILHLLLADGCRRGFSYANLDSIDLLDGDTGQGPVLVVRFAGIVPIEVRITGRRLDALHVHLGDHRIRWVRELPQGKILADPHAEVVTAIAIAKMTGWPDDG